MFLYSNMCVLAASHQYPEELLNIFITLILRILFLLAKGQTAFSVWFGFALVMDLHSVDQQRSVRPPQGFPAVGLNTLCSDSSLPSNPSQHDKIYSATTKKA